VFSLYSRRWSKHKFLHVEGAAKLLPTKCVKELFHGKLFYSHNMESIRSVMQEWREMMIEHREEEKKQAVLMEKPFSLEEFYREFRKSERAFVKSLPTIRRIRRMKPLPPCPICLEEMCTRDLPVYNTRSTYTTRIGKTTSCDHKFHLFCLEQWTKTSLTCPVCRGPVDKNGFIQIF